MRLILCCQNFLSDRTAKDGKELTILRSALIECGNKAARQKSLAAQLKQEGGLWEMEKQLARSMSM